MTFCRISILHRVSLHAGHYLCEQLLIRRTRDTFFCFLPQGYGEGERSGDGALPRVRPIRFSGLPPQHHRPSGNTMVHVTPPPRHTQRVTGKSGSVSPKEV